ncbi:glycosyltransferase family 2 protein [Oribacterium sp. WCC10]|uniref:glycosyltransferase family 2 protein n=1 Tax=Oribacterium sp. WCC10 TaxID=1855343 RepID=UPI001FA93606|nr:glycosyltransferase family 2 protein [Oribacterium sp. WCC10]
MMEVTELKMVSVIMPAFDAAKTIKSSIESVIAQTYSKWELIIVDDCSSDNTVNVVESIIETNKECDIKLVKNEKNMGVAYSRNRGVDESHGEWIAFLDSDDMWDKTKLEKQIRCIERDGLKERNRWQGLLFTGSSFMTKDGRRLQYILHVPERIDRRELLKQNLISCSSVLVSKDLIKKYRFPEGIKTIHEDFAVWLNILSEVGVAHGIDEPLLVYRVAADSKSGKKSKAALMNWNTYKYIGLGPVKRVYYMIHYTLRGLRKWRGLKNSAVTSGKS